MRGVQGIYPRLKDHFKYVEHGDGRVVQEYIFLLFNKCSRTIRMNQILSTFIPNLGVEANSLFNF